MDPQDPFSSPSPTRRSAELQGPRPSPLRVNKDSHRIKKPPIPPHSHHHHLFYQPPLPPPHPAATASTSLNPQPVIIYSVSPKVIHTTVSDFMHLVQSLTGSTPAGAGGADSSGDISPAARFASIENTSPSQRERERSSFFSAAAAVNAATTTYGIEQSTPSERERERWSSSASTSTAAAAAVHGIEHSTPFERERERLSYHSSSNAPVAGGGGGAAAYGGLGEDEISRILDEGNYFSHNYFPGILSPAPATLPPASPPGLFSPAVADPFSNMFIPSPSTLFSAPMVSPSPSSSYSHFFNSSFFDF